MSTRQGIYYWKCDRPAAFHGTAEHSQKDNEMVAEQLGKALGAAMHLEAVHVTPAEGQGNHRTFLADLNGTAAFIRVEDGPEQDDYFDVEAVLLGHVSGLEIPSPRHLGTDSSRKDVPFAWQALERIPAPDLNRHFREGALDLEAAAERIGALVATWQTLEPDGYGPFDAKVCRDFARFAGLHDQYQDYFYLNLDKHLDFLMQRNFLDSNLAKSILHEIAAHEELLKLDKGCLVHKDLALWNILGTPTDILAVIDWDDAISGDGMDDLSLLGCFYDGGVIRRALDGYRKIRPLPSEYSRRFWLHLLRNMIVKAVIRVGAGYFSRGSNFFLIGSDSTGGDLQAFTYNRILTAVAGLKDGRKPEELQ